MVTEQPDFSQQCRRPFLFLLLMFKNTAAMFLRAASGYELYKWKADDKFYLAL